MRDCRETYKSRHTSDYSGDLTVYNENRQDYLGNEKLQRKR